MQRVYYCYYSTQHTLESDYAVTDLIYCVHAFGPAPSIERYKRNFLIIYATRSNKKNMFEGVRLPSL
jgi:hypothetical protein